MVVGFNCEITVNSKCGEQPKPQRSAEKSTEKNTKKEMNGSSFKGSRECVFVKGLRWQLKTTTPII